MYERYLTQAGLSSEQAAIYEILVSSGGLPARAITQKSPIKRGLVYKTLDTLIGLGLAEKSEVAGKVAIFRATHPTKIKEMVDTRAQNAETAKVALNTVIDQLVSDYSLHVGRPGVQFFEGLDGVKKVLKDSLTSDTEIYSYADLEAIDKYIPEINAQYAKDRENLVIKKKGIIIDSPKAREFLANYYPTITETKLIKLETAPFNSVMQIYDGKISYITLAPDKMIGVIIQDQLIYQMHKSLFEYLWNITPEINSTRPIPTDHHAVS